MALQLRAERFAHCSATSPAWPWPLASGVAPPRDAILLVRAKRMQKRAKGRSPLWHPPFWGGVDGLRCLCGFSQVPSAPARESLREKFVGPTRSTRAAVPLRLRPAGSPRVMPASSLPSPACPRSSAPPWPKARHNNAERFPDPEPKIKRCGACALCGCRPRAPRKGQWFVGAKRALPTFREATSEPLPRVLAGCRQHQR